jgi:hypothetical protein
MAFGTADRDNDQIIGFQPLVDLSHIHGLKVNAIRAFHVTSIWRNLPFTHILLLSGAETA